MEGLYTEYEKALYICAYKITRDRQYAEDAVNDAFLSLINHFDGFSEKSESYSIFLFTACKSAAWKYHSLAKGAKEIHFSDTDTFHASDEDEEALFLEKADDIQLHSVISSEYAKLSDEEKTLLIYRMVYRFNYKTISRLTGKHSSALRTAYSRLIKKLKRRLGA